jgi:hypothetical protein
MSAKNGPFDLSVGCKLLYEIEPKSSYVVNQQVFKVRPNLTPNNLVPHSQSSLAFLTQLLGIFSHEIHTILCSNVIVFTFVCQA